MTSRRMRTASSEREHQARSTSMTSGSETNVDGLSGNAKLLLKRLVMLKAPRALLRLLWVMSLAAGGDSPQIVDCFETFSGQAEVTKAMRRRRLRAVTFEKKDHSSDQCDLLSVIGYLHALNCATALVDGSVSMNAPVCSSWGWVNRGTSCRTGGDPLGGLCRGVREANCMVSRLVLLLFIYEARGAWWLLEQPVGSLMIHHPRLQEFLQRGFSVWRTTVRMGCFGGDSAKPLWIYSNRPWVRELSMYTTQWSSSGTESLVYTYVDSDGNRRVNGKKEAMRESQAYTRAFGDAVADVYMKYAPQLRIECAEKFQAAHDVALPDDVQSRDCDDEWVDALLDEMFAFFAT